MVAYRWWPSPAPTARRLSRGSSRTCCAVRDSSSGRRPATGSKLATGASRVATAPDRPVPEPSWLILRVAAAVCEVGRGGILREGLGFDKCDVAIVTNIRHADHLGQYWIQTAEHMAYVKQTVVDAVLPTGTAVLNAEDPLVVPLSAGSKGSVLFFARRPDHPVLVEHRDRGGKTAFVDRGRILLAEGNRLQDLAALDRDSDVARGPSGISGGEYSGRIGGCLVRWSVAGHNSRGT